MGIFSFLFEDTDFQKKKKDNEELAGLDKWQKEDVKKDKYNSYNFEEEELEDDDYYFEDDD